MSKDKVKADPVAEALWGTLESPCQVVNLIEPANVVDGLYAVARAIDRLATAVAKKEGQR